MNATSNATSLTVLGNNTTNVKNMHGTHTKSILQLGYPKKTYLVFMDNNKYLIFIYHNFEKMSFLRQVQLLIW